MGASVGTKGGMSEINMTPLIDIVLVVLIIMMVNMPIELESLGVKVPNPLDTTPPPPPTDQLPEQLVIAMYKDGTVALNRRLMTEDKLFEQITRRLRAMDPKNVFIDADNAVAWGQVVHYIDISRTAGAAKVGLAKVKPAGPAPATSVDQGVMPRGMTVGSPVTLGAIDQPTADGILQPHKAALERCYLDQLAVAPDLNGRIMLREAIDPKGVVYEARVTSSTLDGPAAQAVSDCVQAIGASLAFPALSFGDKATVQYPLLFSP